MENQVVIVGLGRVGSSIGMALSQSSSDLQVVGYDENGEYARQAQRMGAVSKTYRHLSKACKGASLVVLTCALPKVREVLEEIGPVLPEGSVVTDTVAPKMSVLGWAREYLPQGVRFIMGMPLRGPSIEAEVPMDDGPAGARADLFKGGLYCITLAHDTDPDAGTVLVGLARLLEARVLFLDPVEFDGFQAGAFDLPALVAMAFVRMTLNTSSWRDMRKIASDDFAAVAALMGQESRDLSMRVWLNRKNLLPRIDGFMEEMRLIRKWLSQDNEEALEEAWVNGIEGRARWLQERATGDWGEVTDVMSDLPGTGELTARLLVGGPLLRALGEKKERS